MDTSSTVTALPFEEPDDLGEEMSFILGLVSGVIDVPISIVSLAVWVADVWKTGVFYLSSCSTTACSRSSPVVTELNLFKTFIEINLDFSGTAFPCLMSA